MDMSYRQKKSDDKTVENPQSRPGDGTSERHFNVTRWESDITSGIEKLEKQLTGQRTRWDTFVSLRDRWDEGIRIQGTLVTSTQELVNAQEEVKILRQTLENMKEKDQKGQREV